MKVGIYARVSTTDKGQDPELQLRPLREYCLARGWNVVREFTDYCSGAKDTRPKLSELMADARRRSIDCIVVWKLDRFGRSLKHLITALDELKHLGVSFVSHQESLDLSTPSGRLMMQIIGAMAEFERELIRERVRAGLANAKAKGKRVGRRPLSSLKAERITDLREEGLSVRQIADRLKVSVGCVHKTLQNHVVQNGVN